MVIMLRFQVSLHPPEGRHLVSVDMGHIPCSGLGSDDARPSDEG